MAEKTEEKPRQSVAGYSGSGHEGKKAAFKKAEGASDEAVVSECGTTEPTQVFGGDGVTAKAEFDEKYAAELEKHAKKDAERREKLAEEVAGTILTTGKK